MKAAWTAALEALTLIEQREMNEDAALRKTLKNLSFTDRATAEEAGTLLHQVAQRRNALDYLISHALEPPELAELDPGLRSFLRLYAYMTHYSGSPYMEANNLWEQAGAQYGERRLRKVKETRDLIPHQEIPWGSMSGDEELALRSFHPVWYIRHLRGLFDEDTVACLVQPVDPTRYIRVNTLRADESTLSELAELGYSFTRVPELMSTYRVNGGTTGLTGTSQYKQGALILQDLASILVGEVAAPSPGHTVLDVCAAPGAKTSHLAQLMQNRGRITSIDIDARRLAAWSRLMERMGVANADPIRLDASRPYALPDEMDLVVLDPPCSGTGTFNAYPSSKWRLTLNMILEYAGLQRRLLENAAPHVKEGGSLVYSTCSVTLEENEGVIGPFLEHNPEFRLAESAPRIGSPGLRGLVEAQRLYPCLHKSEGFFIARLVKG